MLSYLAASLSRTVRSCISFPAFLSLPPFPIYPCFCDLLSFIPFPSVDPTTVHAFAFLLSLHVFPRDPSSSILASAFSLSSPPSVEPTAVHGSAFHRCCPRCLGAWCQLVELSVKFHGCCPRCLGAWCLHVAVIVKFHRCCPRCLGAWCQLV